MMKQKPEKPRGFEIQTGEKRQKKNTETFLYVVELNFSVILKIGKVDTFWNARIWQNLNFPQRTILCVFWYYAVDVSDVNTVNNKHIEVLEVKRFLYTESHSDQSSVFLKIRYQYQLWRFVWLTSEKWCRTHSVLQTGFCATLTKKGNHILVLKLGEFI